MTEGELTEQDYVRHLRTCLRGTNVRIDPAHDTPDPLKVVEEAVRRRDEAHKEARRQRDRSLAYDSV